MKEINNIGDFEAGQVFMTKKGHKMEVLSIHRDKVDGEEVDNGSVCVKLYTHKDSQNCKAYGWKHNEKFFINFLRVDGKEGLIRRLQIENWQIKE